VLLLRSDCVLDDRLVAALAESEGTLLLAVPAAGAGSQRALGACVPASRANELRTWLTGTRRASQAPAGLRARHPRELVPAYTAALRKSQPPFAIDAADPERRFDVREVEGHLFRASYKGLTDLVTKWLWPAPALAAVRVLAKWHVHPNAITAISWLITIAATWLFANGSFGLALLLAWLMTFLDTVDGKLARCTLTSSRIGDVLDHGLDLVHPPFWWLAYGYGLGTGFETETAIAVAGYFLGRLQEGVFLLWYRIEIHTWRPIDGLFRTITARRNPNLLLMCVGTAGGRPDLGLELVALWTLASFAFHSVRIVQAGWLRRAGREIRPWDEERATAPRRSPQPQPVRPEAGGKP
jgi:phosphatidylglycerophosphate synthase